MFLILPGTLYGIHLPHNIKEHRLVRQYSFVDVNSLYWYGLFAITHEMFSLENKFLSKSSIHKLPEVRIALIRSSGLSTYSFAYSSIPNLLIYRIVFLDYTSTL